MGEDSAQVAAVRDAFAALSRSLKRIAVYRHARDQHAGYLEPAAAALRALLEQRPAVTVAVEPNALVFEGEIVHSEPARETSFLFRLHRDGVRALSFRRGVGTEELLALSEVAVADAAQDGSREDAVTELWKADLAHIGYTAIAGYRMEQAGGGEMLNSIADVSAKAQEVLDRTVGESFAEAAQPLLWTSVERQRRDANHWVDLARRAAVTIARIVEQDSAGWDLDALEEAFWRLVDQMLDRGDTASIAVALDRARKMGGSQANEFRAAVGRRLGDAERLARVVQAATGAERPPLLAVWLQLLPAEAGPTILSVLPLGKDAAAQLVLAGAALARIDSCAAQVAEALRTGTPGEAAALLTASSALPTVRRAELASVAVGHAELAVKLQAAPLLAGDPQTAVRTLGPCLAHPERKLRLAAVQVLGDCKAVAEPAAVQLVAAISRPAFAALDREEHEALFRALGRLGSTTGYTFLFERLSRPVGKFFGRRKAIDEQLLAVQGLAEDGSHRALRALDEAGNADGGHPPAVAAASRAAAQHLRGSRGGRPA